MPTYRTREFMGDRIARQMPREAPVRTEPHPTIVPSPSVTSVASVRCFPIALFVTPRRDRPTSHRFRVTIGLCFATLALLLIAMAKSLEVSPMKSLAEELEFVRKAYRESIQVYSRRVEAQLTALRDIVLKQTNNPNPPPAQLRDLRDMITLCRTLDLKPEKGRRKDLKKIDTLLDELQVLVQNW